ncbi:MULTISPECIES: SDR family oxidoreductase [Streptomyces]|uniref:Short-chain dehydrogenase n=1 Tax=Streptomyces viridochromogenes TaxID=1938 RepID=A0A0L8JA39_STRVR|nr:MULTISPECIES: SDR family oxidoreductase [Streptomyces]KOG10394.1 short-chain dehydrogenase [Streptomyces viridochromogenes]
MTSFRELQGRTVVVTGAARGLGAALVRLLAARGSRVALLGRDHATLLAVAATLDAESHVVEVDVTDEAGMRGAAAEVSRTLGPPSVVIANAGVAEGGPFESSDPDLWRRVVEVNLVGSAVTARAFLPGLFATRGYFLQVASTAAFGAAPMMSAYCASKAGAEAFARSLRAELSHRGVGVGVAYLHWTDTDMIRDVDRHAVLRELRGHMPAPARRVYPVSQVAAWLVRGVERRSASVYAPPWLRLAQVGRPVFPFAVDLLSRRTLPGLMREHTFEQTGLLGEGGRIEERLIDRSTIP